MDTFILVASAIAIFSLGVGFGALLEDKLSKLRNTETRLQNLENTTQKIKIIMADLDDLYEGDTVEEWADDIGKTQELNLDG
jgi:hypothetical protein